MPTSAEMYATPHVLYRFFNRDGALLYLGCTVTPFRRLHTHMQGQPWRLDITRVELEWHPDWLTGRRAEMAAIMVEAPKYNRLVHDPDSVGTTMSGEPRGNGLLCPKCGSPKPARQKTYCRPCQAKYQRDRRIKLGWIPFVREPPTCPRCEGPRVEDRSYCDPCKRIINKEARIRRKEAAERARLTPY